MSEEVNPPPAMYRLFREYKLPIILGGISLLAIAISIVLLMRSVQSSSPIEFSSDFVATGSSELKVDVEGAVEHPGLYSLPDGSRVEDAITAAGGLTDSVDEEVFARTVNRAMKLVDGVKVFIPMVDESTQSSPDSSVLSTSVGGLISVNTASASELETLAGVGPVTAQKIIDNRPYQTLEELLSKKAVGKALLEKIRHQLSL